MGGFWVAFAELAQTVRYRETQTLPAHVPNPSQALTLNPEQCAHCTPEVQHRWEDDRQGNAAKALLRKLSIEMH